MRTGSFVTRRCLCCGDAATVAAVTPDWLFFGLCEEESCMGIQHRTFRGPTISFEEAERLACAAEVMES